VSPNRLAELVSFEIPTLRDVDFGTQITRIETPETLAQDLRLTPWLPGVPDSYKNLTTLSQMPPRIRIPMLN